MLLSIFSILLKVSLLWKNYVCPESLREPKGSIAKHMTHGNFTEQQGWKPWSLKEVVGSRSILNRFPSSVSLEWMFRAYIQGYHGELGSWSAIVLTSCAFVSQDTGVFSLQREFACCSMFSWCHLLMSTWIQEVHNRGYVGRHFTARVNYLMIIC